MCGAPAILKRMQRSGIERFRGALRFQKKMKEKLDNMMCLASIYTGRTIKQRQVNIIGKR